MIIPKGSINYRSKIGHYGVAYPDLAYPFEFIVDMQGTPYVSPKAAPQKDLQPVVIVEDGIEYLTWIGK